MTTTVVTGSKTTPVCLQQNPAPRERVADDMELRIGDVWSGHLRESENGTRKVQPRQELSRFSKNLMSYYVPGDMERKEVVRRIALARALL